MLCFACSSQQTQGREETDYSPRTAPSSGSSSRPPPPPPPPPPQARRFLSHWSMWVETCLVPSGFLAGMTCLPKAGCRSRIQEMSYARVCNRSKHQDTCGSLCHSEIDLSSFLRRSQSSDAEAGEYSLSWWQGQLCGGPTLTVSLFPHSPSLLLAYHLLSTSWKGSLHAHNAQKVML